jgi:UDP-perosamine 4-acetyltransferase
VVGIGAGGHAKILVELVAMAGGYDLVGFTDADAGRWGARLMGYPILGGDERLAELYAQGVRAAFIGVGAISVAGTRLRAQVSQKATGLGFQMVTLTHPQAVVAPSAVLGPGTVVMGGAVLSADVRVGANVTVYAGTVVEHDSILEDHVHLSPGARLAGGVTVREGAFIGIGASIIQGVQVGRWATVGAGAAVLDDVPDGATAVGVPARIVGRQADDGAEQAARTGRQRKEPMA